jgi:NADPH2:quinone reductase
LTAYFLLKEAPLAAGESVLVNAAAAESGSLAIQIAKLLGAGTVIGTASTPEKRQMVEDLSADVAVDYTHSSWAGDVKSATNGRGIDVFLDATGELDGEGLRLWPKAVPGWFYGAQSGGFNSLPGERAVATRLGQRRDTPTGSIAGTHRLDLRGELKIDSQRCFPLSHAAQAHAAIEARQTTGKVVLQP